ncbi:MAG: hypothetical protein VB071_02180 [Lawsonibacter sp.]|nr:hypothetical protein [Lawsonibacter sp.]
MLWKLLKYDFRSIWRQFAIIWPAALVLALANRFTLPLADHNLPSSAGGNSILVTVTMSVFVGVLCAMVVVSMIFIIKRFYQGLLGDEGYLMHTLPVKTWQLVAAKLICAVVVTAINTVVAVLSMFLLVPIQWVELFNWKIWKMLFHGLAQHPDTILYVIEVALLALAVLVFGLTTLYLSMAIGHLFQRRRVLMSVAAFFVIDILCNVVTDAMDRWGLLNIQLDTTAHASIWICILFMAVPASLFFAGTSYILKHRLNLE